MKGDVVERAFAFIILEWEDSPFPTSRGRNHHQIRFNPHNKPMVSSQ